MSAVPRVGYLNTQCSVGGTVEEGSATFGRWRLAGGRTSPRLGLEFIASLHLRSAFSASRIRLQM